MVQASMSEEEIAAKLAILTKEALRIDVSRITGDSRIFDDLGAESLDLLDIRFRIEREFGFEIDQGEMLKSLGESLTDAEIRERLTVRSLVRYIHGRLSADVPS
jgi:acyl carrier protein